MALKSIRNKIANMTGGEVLGEADAEFKESEVINNQSKKPKNKIMTKKPTTKKAKPVSRSSETLVKSYNKTSSNLSTNSHNKTPANLGSNPENKTFSNKTEKKASQVNILNNAIEGYEDVLAILGIKEEVEVEVDFKSDDMDYVEFSQTTPLGFDFDEVTDFISRTKYTLYKLESALAQRNKDIVTIASEVKKVEQKMMEKNQERELDKMLGGMTEEERLITDNMDLKVEINNLEREKSNLLRELDEARKNSVLVEELREELAELKRTKSSEKFTGLPSGLPMMDNTEDLESVDPFDDMIKDIGGFYDE